MKPRSRKAFTLVELVVVMAILISLFGLVLSGARTSRRGAADIRRGAQQLASILLASQSLSLGSPTGAAVIIDSEGIVSKLVSQARRFPFIEGVVDQGMPPANPAVTSTVVTLQPDNDDPLSLPHGYKVRFFERTVTADGPLSEWFSMACESPPTATVRLRSEDGQTPRTALWPSAPKSGKLSFQAARYPIPAGLSQALPEGVAIDLRYSGYGDQSLTNWVSFAAKGAIGVGFDPVGAVDSLMQNVLPEAGRRRTVQPITPHDHIYFFVTFRSEIEDPAVNPLASDNALWVVLQPRTGRVTIAPNVPQEQSDEAAVMEARTKARQGTSVGG
ncbi:MAG: type II secretion system protein [Planctomycetota bacterium]